MERLLFSIVLVVIAMCEADRNIGSLPFTDESNSTMCVCRPKITINPPVCARSPATDSGIHCNSSTIQDIVSTGQLVTRRQLDELQTAVSGSQETVSSKLEDTRRQLEELQVTVSALVQLLNGEFKTFKKSSSQRERVQRSQTLA